MAILSLLIAGVLYFLVNWTGPDLLNAYRAHKTEAALAEAREALLGYATRYRDTIDPNTVYGFLLLPDLGHNPANWQDRNNNVGCKAEGCDAGNFAGNGGNITVIGRFPWRTLGTGPLRDGYGECLWLVVSGSHQRVQPSAVMNWDSLGHLDLVVASGNANLTSMIASAHDRPVAIVFSPGPPLPNQNRSPDAVYDTSECGGNYDVKNYLDPDVAGALAGVTNYFGGSTNNASGDTSAADKSMTIQGAIQRRADATLWPQACPAGGNCSLAANDKGLALTPDALFGAIRKSSSFRTDINTMLDRMVTCLRDQMASGGAFIPENVGTLLVADKSVGRISSDPFYANCYNQTPIGYFANWHDMLFVAKPTAGTFNVTVDGLAQACNGVLIFAGQRGPGQSRVAALGEQDIPANYLEGVNLASFTAVGTAFAGAGLFDVVSATQSAQQDIVRCIPTTTSMETVNPPALVDGSGNALGPMADYDPGTRTLTLGSADATTTNGVSGNSLYGCAWTAEVDTRGKGFRTYFAFRFMGVTGGVGNNGIVFAAIDGESNGTGVCGAAGSHLGYSGNNGVTPPLRFPKIGIEFDQGRNVGAISNALNSGRNDPCGTSGCGGTAGYNSHSAIVYWGSSSLDYDDNVHGAGSTPDPQNPNNIGAATPGITFANSNFRGNEDVNGDGTLDSYLYHVRVEVTPTRNVNASAAESSNTSFVTQVWIVRDSVTDAQIIAAMQNTTRPMAQLYSGASPTLADTATVYDVAGGACGGACPTNQTCGTDNVCYRQGLKSVRLGFTGSQRTQDQQVLISNFITSWLQ
jgi:hypothetical protein